MVSQNTLNILALPDHIQNATEWLQEGCNNTETESPDKDPIIQWSKLPTAHINQIKATLKNNPNARIYYINKFYVLSSAELKTKEGKLITGTAEINASSVLIGNSAFTFKDSQEDTRHYGQVVLNYWGDEFNLIEVYNPLNNIRTISGEPTLITAKQSILTPTLQPAEPLSTYEITEGVFASE